MPRSCLHRTSLIQSLKAKLSKSKTTTYPPRSTNQDRALEHNEAGHMARLRFSFNLFASF